MFRNLGIFISLILFIAPLDLRSQGIEPGDVVIDTPDYKPGPSNRFVEGIYTYGVSWQGIPAASAKMEVRREGDKFRLVASARTAKGVDIFYKLRYRAEGLINSLDFTPLKTIIDKRENSRVKNTQIVYEPTGEIVSIKARPGEDPKIIRFTSTNNTLEPFSAAFLARSLDWKVGEKKVFDTYNGDNRYLVEFTCEDEIKMPVNGVDRKVWVLKPFTRNLTKPDAKRKIREAWIYLTADDEREILQIKSEVFIGNVFTKLETFEPLSPHTDPVQVAEQRASSAVRWVF